jgi:hypothetical protein
VPQLFNGSGPKKLAVSSETKEGSQVNVTVGAASAGNRWSVGSECRVCDAGQELEATIAKIDRSVATVEVVGFLKTVSSRKSALTLAT